MAEPLVSILIPTYSCASFIDETLSSALQQEYGNLEVVVADDCSSDGTAETIMRYAARFPGRLVALVGGPHLGVTGNCNRALDACRGKYIAFQGGDDVLLPGKITKQVEWLEADERRGICYHDVEIFDSESGKTICLSSDRHPKRQGGVKELLRYGHFFHSISAMIRSSLKPPNGFDSRIPISSDWLFWIEILARNPGIVVGCVDGVLARYRLHKNNITRQAYAYGLEEELVTLAIIEARFPTLLSLVEAARARRKFAYGIKSVLKGKYKIGLRYLMNATMANPTVILTEGLDGLRWFRSLRRRPQ